MLIEVQFRDINHLALKGNLNKGLLLFFCVLNSSGYIYIDKTMYHFIGAKILTTRTCPQRSY